jgi:ATP-dependent protease ClpP protease subunit
MPRHWFALACCLALGACGAPSKHDPDEGANGKAPGLEVNGTGAFISAPAETPPPAFDIRRESTWPPAEVGGGQATISCELDYAAHGDGVPLVNLEFFSVVDALKPCQERGVMRLRYHGNIDAGFTSLVERVAEIAKRMDIDRRVLDIDSLGGQVEDAIRAGDAIGASGWTIWVREGASCHSACVLILGAGDVRMISGRVGIHRIIRMSSTATTRAQLNEELQAVYGRVKAYLERNGVAVAVGDLMMAVPNRNLRLLTPAELQEYGLDGTNPAQDDLDRLQLMRKCGEDFVSRRDSFARAFDRECKAGDKDVDELNACGLALRPRFGFPDATCPDDSPMSEFDPIRSAFFDRKQEVVPNADARRPAVTGARG